MVLGSFLQCLYLGYKCSISNAVVTEVIDGRAQPRESTGLAARLPRRKASNTRDFYTDRCPSTFLPSAAVDFLKASLYFRLQHG
jgi:hypothetical protein